MLAVLGHVTTTAGVRLPGYLSTSADIKFEDVPSGLAAFSKIPFAGVMQIFLFIGFLEVPHALACVQNCCKAKQIVEHLHSKTSR